MNKKTDATKHHGVSGEPGGGTDLTQLSLMALMAIPDPVLVYDHDGRIQFCNPAAVPFFGYDLEGLHLKKTEEIVQFQPLREGDMESAHKTFLATGSWSGEGSVTKRNGERVLVQITVSRLTDPAMDSPGYVLVLYDLATKRPKDRPEPHDRNDWATFYWSATRGPSFISEAFHKLTGYDEEDFRSDPRLVHRIFHPEDRSLVATLMRSPDFPPIVTRLIRKDGTTIWVEILRKPIRDVVGNVLAVDGFVRDISEKKAAEEKLNKTEADILNLAARQMETPLLFIKAAVRTYLDSPNANERLVEQLFEIIGRQADVLSGLIVDPVSLLARFRGASIRSHADGLDAAGHENEKPPLAGALSSREIDVVQLTAEGFGSHEIAERLNISPKSVYTYRERAMEKLNLVDRRDLVRYALRWGLLRAE